MDSTLISIIVPVYNVGLYLEKCIDSIVAQTYSNIEIILVNDGSTDNSGAICDRYKQSDPRIVVIHKPNGGLSDARNAGLEIAKGEYISFVDSDDYIHTNFIAYLFNIIADADVSICDFEDFSDDNHVGVSTVQDDVKELSSNDYLRLLTDLNHANLVVAWNKLYKKELWESYRYLKGLLHEDEYAIHHLINNCKKIRVGRQKYYFYRQRPNSITSAARNEKSFLDKLGAFYDRYIFFKGANMIEEEKKMLIHLLAKCALPTVKEDNSIWQELRKEKYWRHVSLPLKQKIILEIKCRNYMLFVKLVQLFK